MATAILLPQGQQQYCDGNGRPLAGGSVTYYVPNTTTLASVWQDEDESVVSPNPILLDANGMGKAFGSGNYLMVVKDVNGVTLWSALTSSSAVTISIGALGGAALAGDNTFTGTNRFENSVVISGDVMDWSNADAISAAGVLAIQGANGNLVPLQGAGSITSTDLNSGSIRVVRFLAAGITLVNSASLIVPTNGNLVSQVGDTMWLEGEAGGVTRVAFYQRFSGAALQASAAFSSLRGNVQGKKIITTAGAATGVLSCDEVTLETAAGLYITGKNLALGFAVTTVGVGGLDTGAATVSTWYHVYFVSDGTNFNVLLSLSATAPAVVGAYTYYAYAGAIRTTSGSASQLQGVLQYGNRAQWIVDGAVLTAMPLIGTGTTASAWSARAWGNFAPVTAAGIVLTLTGTLLAWHAGAAPNANYGSPTATTNPPPIAGGTNAGSSEVHVAVQGTFLLEDATNVYYWSDDADTRLFVGGWIYK